MRRWMWLFPGVWLVVACQGAPARFARPGGAGPEPALRLEKVRLYEAGVGYFERAGTLAPGAGAFVVPDAHLDDALRTLVVISGAGAGAPRLEFESVMPRSLALARASLPADAGNLRYREVLESLVAARVEVVTKSERMTGRLLEVSAAPPVLLANPPADASEKDDAAKFVPSTVDDLYLTVAGDSGLRRFRASETVRVRPVDAERRALLERALGERSLEDGARRLELRNASGPLRLGYVAEVPRFRATYRLFVEPASARAKLVGVALVHNASDERWSQVELTLASTRPDSFVADLALPTYVHREALQEKPDYSELPQLGAGTGGAGMRAPSPASGATTKVGSFSVRADERRPHAAGSFEYRARERVELRARSTALVPFLEAAVGARPFVWFATPKAPAKRALNVTNTTGQTLPEGTLAVFTPSGYAGEAILPRLLPNASAPLPFADDTDVGVELASDGHVTTPLAVAYDDSRFEQRERHLYERTYVITNRKPEAVSVAIGLGLRGVVKAQGFDRVDGEQGPIGVFEVAKHEKATRKTAVEQEASSSSDTESVGAERFRELSLAKALPVAQRATLKAAAAIAARIEAIGTAAEKVGERETELAVETAEARSALSETPTGAALVVRELALRLLALEREQDRAKQRSAALQRDSERLVGELERVLASLPKPKKAR